MNWYYQRRYNIKSLYWSHIFKWKFVCDYYIFPLSILISLTINTLKKGTVNLERNYKNYESVTFYNYHPIPKKKSSLKHLLRHTSKQIKEILKNYQIGFHRTVNYFERELRRLSQFYYQLWIGDVITSNVASFRWTVPMTGLATFLLFQSRLGSFIVENRGNHKYIG